MAISLDPVEARILGALIEKSLALPAYYPMTLSAIVTACNQKSNRDPVMELPEGQVASALHHLQEWQLVSQAPPERNSRSNRFQHEVEARFGWNAAQRAVMAELLLRGPQTLGELRGRASRMTHLDSTDYIRDLLMELMHASPPMVIELSRQPGQSTTRFAHLLGDAPAASPPIAAARPVTAAVAPSAGSDAESSEAAGVHCGLDVRIAELEKRLAELHEQVRAIQQHLVPPGA